MPEQSLSANPTGPLAQSVAAWFGKLPSLGDFVGRRMPHNLGGEWHTWLRSGLDELRNEAGGGWVNQFVQSPIWFFMCPDTVTGVSVAGVVAPSIDRVGRYYPITIMAAAAPGENLFASDARLGAFFAGARSAVIDARRLPLSAEDLDARLAYLGWPFEQQKPKREPSLINDILSDLEGASTEPALSGLGIEMPTLDWRTLLSQEPQTSLWWISPTQQFAHDQVVHHGPLDRPLFMRLFKGKSD